MKRTVGSFAAAALLLMTGFGESPLTAQLTRPVNARPSTAAPRVELSERTTFSNRDIVPFQLLPYGEDFFLSTYREVGNITTATRTELSELVLYRYNAELKRSGTFQVAWPDEARDHIGLTSLGDALLWTFMTRGRERNTFDVRAEVLNGDGKLLSEHRLLTVHQRELAQLADLEAYSANRGYYVRAYADESQSSLFSKRDDERATVTLAVFDRMGTPITIERKRLRVNRDQLELQSAAVDDDGTAYLLAKVYTSSKGRETRRGSDSKVYLYTLAPGAEDLERTELKLAGQYIEGVSMVPGLSGRPAIVGVYSERIDGRIVGYFADNNPSAGNVLKPQPFSQDLLERLGRRVTSRRGGRLVLEGQYEFGEALRLRDGRLSLLLESIRITQQTGPAGGIGMQPGMTTNTNYTFSDALLLTFSNDAELQEALMVPMFQSYTLQQNFATRRASLGSVPPYYRASLVEYDGKPAVIYNDNPRNFGRDIERTTKALRFRDAVATLAFADEDGRLRQQPVFSRREADQLILIPRSTERLINDDVVFMATRFRTFNKNELSFGRISSR